MRDTRGDMPNTCGEMRDQARETPNTCGEMPDKAGGNANRRGWSPCRIRIDDDIGLIALNKVRVANSMADSQLYKRLESPLPDQLDHWTSWMTVNICDSSKLHAGSPPLRSKRVSRHYQKHEIHVPRAQASRRFGCGLESDWQHCPRGRWPAAPDRIRRARGPEDTP